MAIEITDPNVVADVKAYAKQLGVSDEEAVAYAVLYALLERRTTETADPLMRRVQLAVLEDRLTHLKAAYAVQ